MKFLTNENAVAIALAIIGVFAYDVVQDVRQHNVAFAKHEIRFAGYDGMSQIVQDIRMRVDAIERKQDRILEELDKKHRKEK